jgi:hypothetical protein
VSEFEVFVVLPTTRCLPNCVPRKPAVPRNKSRGFSQENYNLKGENNSRNVITNLTKTIFVSVSQLFTRSNISEFF